MSATSSTPGPLEILSDAVEGYCDIETGVCVSPSPASPVDPVASEPTAIEQQRF